MLTINELIDARKIVSSIQKLDKEIIKLERNVLDMINGVSKFEISMHFTKEKENVNKSLVEEFETSPNGLHTFSGFSLFYTTKTTPESNIIEDKFYVNEELSLKMIELYAKELIKHRQSLIIKLEKYNVSI